jgi:hypothetical protein
MTKIGTSNISMLGSTCVGFDMKGKDKEENTIFRSFYRIGPLALEKMLHDIQTVQDKETGKPI